jgi:hypothetical protein
MENNSNFIMTLREKRHRESSILAFNESGKSFHPASACVFVFSPTPARVYYITRRAQLMMSDLVNAFPPPLFFEERETFANYLCFVSKVKSRACCCRSHDDDDPFRRASSLRQFLCCPTKRMKKTKLLMQINNKIK